MAAKDRCIDQAGNPVPFSCENRGYRTNIDIGKPHGKSATRGSVLPVPLATHNSHSLWLEHVYEKETRESLYWLMWYDDSGTPTIPLSGVFDKADLSEMAKQLVQFVP